MEIYNYIQWKKDGEFAPSVGQEVDIEIYLDLRDCMPPAWNSNGLFQVGEPYDHDYKTFDPLWVTLKKNEQGKWIYCGHCYLGKTEDKTERGYGYLRKLFSKLR